MTNNNARIMIRKQLDALTQPSPLLAAMLEWYRSLPLEQQQEVERSVEALKHAVDERGRVQFGVSSALELIGAGIAIKEGWRKPNGKD